MNFGQLIQEVQDSRFAQDDAHRVKVRLETEANAAILAHMECQRRYQVASARVIEALGEDGAAIHDGRVWFVVSHLNNVSLRSLRLIDSGEAVEEAAEVAVS